MMQSIVIPAGRMAVLLGKGGSVKRGIEQSTGASLSVDAGFVGITGEPEGVLTAGEVVKAIGRGFPPEKAFRLLKEGNQLAVVSLGDQTDKGRKRVLSRVIGRGGRARRTLEKLSGTLIRVYGKTVSIIGPSEDVAMAVEAVEDLVSGRKHAYVYSKLEKMKRLS